MIANPSALAPVIREMRQTDVPRIAAIEREAYEFPWSPGIFRDCLLAGYTSLVTEYRGDVIAYAIMSVAAGEAHLLNLCVAAESPACRSRSQPAGRRDRPGDAGRRRAHAPRSAAVQRGCIGPVRGLWVRAHRRAQALLPRQLRQRGCRASGPLTRPRTAAAVDQETIRTPLTAPCGWQRPVLGWALYDWANSAFALSVMTAFVPVLLAGYWNDGAPSSVGTFRLGLANGVASLVVAVLAPIIGALADHSGRRKAWLLWITFLGVVMTAGALPGSGRHVAGCGRPLWTCFGRLRGKQCALRLPARGCHGACEISIACPHMATASGISAAHCCLR